MLLPLRSFAAMSPDHQTVAYSKIYARWSTQHYADAYANNIHIYTTMYEQIYECAMHPCDCVQECRAQTSCGVIYSMYLRTMLVVDQRRVPFQLGSSGANTPHERICRMFTCVCMFTWTHANVFMAHVSICVLTIYTQNHVPQCAKRQYRATDALIDFFSFGHGTMTLRYAWFVASVSWPANPWRLKAWALETLHMRARHRANHAHVCGTLAGTRPKATQCIEIRNTVYVVNILCTCIL